VAFLVGWRYTTAFYDRLGIATEALNLEPATYLTAKIEVWYVLAGAAMSLLSAMVASRLFPPAPGVTLWVGTVSIAAGMPTFVAGCVAAGETGEAEFVYVCGLGASLVLFGIYVVLQGEPHRYAAATVWMAATALIVFAIAFVDLVPAELGRHDAEALLAGPQEGSGARLVAAEPIGLPGERYESDAYVTESVGVVRATGDTYFVVVRGTEMVYSFPAARVLRIEYTPDKGR